MKPFVGIKNRLIRRSGGKEQEARTHPARVEPYHTTDPVNSQTPDLDSFPDFD